jgi:hypothetical protein
MEYFEAEELSLQQMLKKIVFLPLLGFVLTRTHPLCCWCKGYKMYLNEEQGFAFAFAAQDPGAAPPGWHQFTNQTSLITPENLTTGHGRQATSPMLHPSSPMLRPSSPMLRPSSPLYRYAMSPAMSYVDRLSPAMYGAEPIFVVSTTQGEQIQNLASFALECMRS